MTCPRVATAVTWRGYGTDVEISRVRFLQSSCGGATHPSVRDMYDCGSIVAWLIRLFAARRRQLAIDRWHRNAWDVSAYMFVLFNSRRSVYDSFFLCKWRCLVCSTWAPRSTVLTVTSCYSDYEASFGIGGQAFSWIASFLQDQTQQVCYKRCLSEVPQVTLRYTARVCFRTTSVLVVRVWNVWYCGWVCFHLSRVCWRCTTVHQRTSSFVPGSNWTLYLLPWTGLWLDGRQSAEAQWR